MALENPLIGIIFNCIICISLTNSRESVARMKDLKWRAFPFHFQYENPSVKLISMKRAFRRIYLSLY